MRKRRKVLIAVVVLSVLILVIVVLNVVSGNDEGVCEMFLSNGSMYYTDYKDTLYRYDNTLGKGEIVSKLDIRNAGRVIEDKGYIYYSNGSTIFRKNLVSGATEKIIAGKNIGIHLIAGNRLIYGAAYKAADNGGYSQFEYRIYNLATGKDDLLFKRSEDIWQFFNGQGNIVMADGSLKDDSGLYVIDLETGIKKKLINTRVSEGYLANGKFYYTSQPLNNLRSIDLNSENLEEIPLPGSGEENFVIHPITGSGDFLYAAVRFLGKHHLIRMDIKTQDATILADGLGSVWELCTDGNRLYAYDTKYPADKKGNITVIFPFGQ